MVLTDYRNSLHAESLKANMSELKNAFATSTTIHDYEYSVPLGVAVQGVNYIGQMGADGEIRSHTLTRTYYLASRSVSDTIFPLEPEEKQILQHLIVHYTHHGIIIQLSKNIIDRQLVVYHRCACLPSKLCHSQSCTRL